MKPVLSGQPQDLSKCLLNRGCPLNRSFSYKGKYHKGANFGTRLSVRLIKGVRLIAVLLHVFQVSTDFHPRHP